METTYACHRCNTTVTAPVDTPGREQKWLPNKCIKCTRCICTKCVLVSGMIYDYNTPSRLVSIYRCEYCDSQPEKDTNKEQADAIIVLSLKRDEYLSLFKYHEIDG